MLDALAEVLGVDDDQLHHLLWLAARRAGVQEDGVIVSWARGATRVPDRSIMRSLPNREAVMIVYGTHEKVELLANILHRQMQDPPETLRAAAE